LLGDLLQDDLDWRFLDPSFSSRRHVFLLSLWFCFCISFISLKTMSLTVTYRI
jgi:hypothetical protein